MGKNGVTGIIIPIDAPVADRVFHHRPIVPVFVDEFPVDLAVGDRAFLYERGGGRVLLGEGGIEGISHEDADAVKKYLPQLCLSSIELDEYIKASGKSSSDPMMVLKLEDHPVKYARPLKCSMKVRSSGEYVSAEVFSKIFAENE